MVNKTAYKVAVCQNIL